MAGRGSIRRATLTLRALHGGLVASLGVYAVVLYTAARQAPPQPPKTFEELATMFYILVAFGAGTLVALPFVRSMLLPRRLPPQRLDEQLDDKPRSKAASRALEQLFTALITSWAMAESVAIYGLILGFMMREMWPYLAFGAPALVVMLLAAPRRSLVEAVVRAAE